MSVACPGSLDALKKTQKKSRFRSWELRSRPHLLGSGCRALSAALVYCRAASASQAAADMMGLGRSRLPVSGRWQPRAKASLSS